MSNTIIRPRSASLKKGGTLPPETAPFLSEEDHQAIRTVLDYVEDDYQDFLNGASQDENHVGHALRRLHALLHDVSMSDQKVPVEPRICVVSLDDCNEGKLFGGWISLTPPIETIRDEIRSVTFRPGCSETDKWFIHDYEGFGSLQLGTFEELDLVVEVARHVRNRHGAVLAALLATPDGPKDLRSACQMMDEQYYGPFDSWRDYAECHVKYGNGYLVNQLPNVLARHFDYDAIAGAIRSSGQVFGLLVDGKLHVVGRHDRS